MPQQTTNLPTSYQLEPFFELQPDLLCIAGYDGYFRRINPAVSKVLGYTEEELYSRPIMSFVYEDDLPLTLATREQVTKNKPLYNYENRYVTKSGELVWLSWTSLPVDSEQLVFAIAKDITHKKKLETERNELLSSLTRANKDLKQLTYTTSHDLRAPVNNLLSVFNLLDTSTISDEDTLAFIAILKSSAENLKNTLNTYVDVLAEKEGLLEEAEQVDLAESLAEVQNSIGSLIKSSKTTFHVDFSELASIRFNRVYMESVFLNLITNSIKYARPDLYPVIYIRSQVLNGNHQLTFSDNGLGFDMDKVRGRLFGFHQRFHHHIDSKGIGLYLVYNHITSFGGTIAVDSRVNEGATFKMGFKS
ncbi:PAS domain S-box protein [Flavihumibacter sp. R14]|nr:PAS domain S-box protein [Flavihumibacter soli]